MRCFYFCICLSNFFCSFSLFWCFQLNTIFIPHQCIQIHPITDELVSNCMRKEDNLYWILSKTPLNMFGYFLLITLTWSIKSLEHSNNEQSISILIPWGLNFGFTTYMLYELRKASWVSSVVIVNEGKEKPTYISRSKIMRIKIEY